ncbi:MAG: GNAT family N-acetyltransferase [Acidobacteria bacterium RIFCSPLOWO2_12_FULL_54_10]|nr:MAG: GNAT family N-acetyltransferase [Acidobacteria bacterium RIFCSPLOWO2_12_FULL_54_10]
MPTPKFLVQPLGPHHDRAGFSCGVEPLDDYLKRQARQDVRKRVSAAFVLTPNGETIAGYYTLSQYSIDLGALPQELARRLPKYPIVPATLIGRLAVSTAFRGQGLGELLLMDALHRSLTLSRQVASAAVIVDAKDNQAITFYRKYGFLELPSIARRLFLPMITVEQMFH